jgi:hypothetical protein
MRLGRIIAAPDPGTVPRLADQLTHRVQEVDVVAGEIVDVLECREGWQFQSVIADQPPDHRPILLLDLCELRDYADEAGFGKLWPRRWSA